MDSGNHYVAIQNALDEAAAIAARHEAHGNKVQAYAAGKLARCYVTIRRYKPKARIYHEWNANGRQCYMSEKAHAIYIEAMKEVKLGHQLHTRQIANVTGASQGYVTKTLQWLCAWHFLDLVKVVRGRYGYVLLKLATAFRQSFLHSAKRYDVYGGMINAAATNRAAFEAYVATLRDGDIYVPASRR